MLLQRCAPHRAPTYLLYLGPSSPPPDTTKYTPIHPHLPHPVLTLPAACPRRSADYAVPFRCPLDYMLDLEIIDWQQLNYRNAGFLDLPQVGASGGGCGWALALASLRLGCRWWALARPLTLSPRPAAAAARLAGPGLHPQQPGGGADSGRQAG